MFSVLFLLLRRNTSFLSFHGPFYCSSLMRKTCFSFTSVLAGMSCVPGHSALWLQKPLFVPFRLQKPLLASPFVRRVFPPLLWSARPIFNPFSLRKIHKRKVTW